MREHSSGIRRGTADFDGCFKLEEIGLLHEDFLGDNAELADLRLGELHLLPWLAPSDFQKPIYDVVQNSRVHFHTLSLSKEEELYSINGLFFLYLDQTQLGFAERFERMVEGG